MGELEGRRVCVCVQWGRCDWEVSFLCNRISFFVDKKVEEESFYVYIFKGWILRLDIYDRFGFKEIDIEVVGIGFQDQMWKDVVDIVGFWE